LLYASVESLMVETSSPSLEGESTSGRSSNTAGLQRVLRCVELGISKNSYSSLFIHLVSTGVADPASQ